MKYFVKNGQLFTNPNDAGKAIPLGSKDWFHWLARHDRFIYQTENVRFSARRESRRGKYYWYGYCRRAGKLRKVYLGKASDLTQDRLIAAGKRMKSLVDAGTSPDHVSLPDLTSSSKAAVLSSANRKGIKVADVSFALKNRLTPPSLPTNLIARPRLIGQINRPITLISAPSGFGKTTLLNQWQDQCPFPVAWMSLEKEENKAHAFLAALTLALQQVGPVIGDTISNLLQSPSPPPIEHLISRLIHNLNRWLAAQPDRHLALIIDNYQQVQNPEINATCQFFLDHLLGTMQVIIASQVQFPFAVQRWRGKGYLTELTNNDLRLTLTESVAWLDRTVIYPLTAREKVALALKVDGWVAGLNILALALNKQDDVHRFIAIFDGYHPYLQEYLVTEILRTHPTNIQNFLLQTSILRNLSGPLCDAVTEQSSSQQILQRLFQENQLVTLLDEEQGWYQYHDLFSQSLQHQLQRQFPHQVHDLHWRAAAWYQDHELYSEAIHHFVLARAWSRVARLIDQVILDELCRGSDHHVLKWLQQLPEEVFLHHRNLLFIYARLGATSLPQGHVEGFLSNIAARIEAKPVTARTPNEQALLAALKDWEWVGERDQAYPAIKPSSDEIGQLWQMLDLRDQGLRLIKGGRIATGERVLLEAIEAAKAKGMLFVVVMVGLEQISLIARQGQLRQAEALTHEILQWLQAQRGSLPACASVLLIALSKIHYARNHLTKARQLIEETAIIDPHPTSVNIVMFAHGLLAHILNAQGDSEAAQTTLQAALELEPYTSSLFSVHDLMIHQAMIFLRQGNVTAAEHTLRQTAPHMQQPYQAVNELFRTAWAELFLTQEKYQEAEAALRHSGETTPDRLLFVFPFHKLLLAQAYWAQHKVNQAQREMIWAIRAVEPEGIIRPFLDCGSQIIPLLSFLLHGTKLSNGHRHFVSRLLDQLYAAYPDAPVPTPVELADRSEAAKISPREQQILQLVAEGLNNRALASRLIVTDSTVRTHLRNIYRKLGVTSRTQAIQRARELQLL